MSFLDSDIWIQVMTLIGEVTFFLILGMLLAAIALAIIAAASITRGKFYLPQILIPGMVLLEGLVKAFCKLLGLDDKDLITFFITLRNTMNTKAFSETPVEQRAVFLPQCLRSAQCPANLTPEGLKCRNCGRCSVGEHTAWLDVHQTDGKEVSSAGDHRRRLPHGGKRRDRYVRPDRDHRSRCREPKRRVRGDDSGLGRGEGCRYAWHQTSIRSRRLSRPCRITARW